MEDNVKILAIAVIEVAKKEIGKEEIPVGSNWGPNVKMYLDSVGINFPASWCMGFVHWCFDQACKQLCINNPLFKSGGVLSVWNHTDPNKRTTQPKPGDVFIMDFGGGLGHTGIVLSVDGDKIHTIEGNTNDTGSREGYEVCKKVRSINKCKGFIRVAA